MKTLSMHTKPAAMTRREIEAKTAAMAARAKRLEALEDHVDTYLDDNPGANAVVLRDAVEHGWHGAHADLAETLRDLLVECRAEVERHMPFPILVRLDAIVTDLEDGMAAPAGLPRK